MLLDLTLGPLTEPWAGRHWDRSAVIDQWRRRLAFYARHRLVPGDRVFLHYGNTAEFFVDLVALWSLGACAVPIDSRLTPFEVETLARPRRRASHCGPATRSPAWNAPAGAGSASWTPARRRRQRRTTAPRRARARPRRRALILFTSGTTGAPKGVVHTHRSLRARWMALRQCLGIEAFRRTLCLLPTHFGHGLICNSLFPWLSGQHLFILPPFRTDVVMQLGALLDEHRITFLSSVPSVWRLALKTAKPPQSPALKRVFCGSAPLSAHLWARSEMDRCRGGLERLRHHRDRELAGGDVDGGVHPAGRPGRRGLGRRRAGSPHARCRRPARREDLCSPGEYGYVWSTRRRSCAATSSATI